MVSLGSTNRSPRGHRGRAKNSARNNKREIRNVRIGGESDWPIIAILAIYVEKNVGTRECDSLLLSWVKNVVAANVGRHPEGIPNPYWLQEKILALHYGTLPPY